MKRLILFAALIVPAASALAFDPDAEPTRIAILETSSHEDALTGRVASMMRRYLIKELQQEGFTAFETTYRYEDLTRDDQPEADYYIELVEGRRSDMPEGAAAGIGGNHVFIEVGMVTSSVGTGIHIYDARSLELLDEIDVQARSRSFAPTAAGIGRWHTFWLSIPLPGRSAQRAARDAAREAAAAIAEALQPPSSASR
jgi:hypothetical protein